MTPKILPVKPVIKFDDLQKLDIRVGLIKRVDEINPVLAVPEKPVLNGVSAG